MWTKNGFTVSALLALFLLVPSFGFSQSFDPEKVYQVTGAQLNRLSQDLLTAKKSLADSLEENAKLKKQSDDKQVILDELQTQLQTASQLLKKSERQTLENELMIGGVCIVAGIVVGVVWKKL